MQSHRYSGTLRANRAPGGLGSAPSARPVPVEPYTLTVGGDFGRQNAPIASITPSREEQISMITAACPGPTPDVACADGAPGAEGGDVKLVKEFGFPWK